MKQLFAVLALAPAACAPIAPVDTATMAPGALGSNQDVDTGAINVALYVFASATPSRVNPVDVARGSASVDYLAGELASNPRFLDLSPLVKEQMLGARRELRAALGVAPGAPSQSVVDGLLGVANAELAGSARGAEAALPADVFTLGPPATLARLQNLPALPQTNVATVRLNAALTGPSNTNCFGCR